MAARSLKNRIRIRACGLLVESGRLLLVQIHSPVTGGLAWMPPGGGLEFGESLESCLEREFREETGLEITLNSLAFINELIEPPYHALEFYYHVEKTGGALRLGADPEMDEGSQLLKDIRWTPIDTLDEIVYAPAQLKNHFLS